MRCSLFFPLFVPTLEFLVSVCIWLLEHIKVFLVLMMFLPRAHLQQSAPEQSLCQLLQKVFFKRKRGRVFFLFFFFQGTFRLQCGGFNFNFLVSLSEMMTWRLWIVHLWGFFFLLLFFSQNGSPDKDTRV